MEEPERGLTGPPCSPRTNRPASGPRGLTGPPLGGGGSLKDHLAMSSAMKEMWIQRLLLALLLMLLQLDVGFLQGFRHECVF